MQIHETFGPTSLPMYQVRFNSSFPLDVNEARVSRPVFHVPARSKYVFVAELSKLRGSDASNVHDEEPGEYELEFSDDEAEVKHKTKLKDRSVSFSSYRSLGVDAHIKHGTDGMPRANRVYPHHQPMSAIRTWMPPLAGTHMLSTACTTWTWTMAQAPRARCRSHTTIRTRMHTTGQRCAKSQRRPDLPRLQDPSADVEVRRGKAILDKVKGAMASVHITTIVNVGEGEGARGIVVTVVVVAVDGDAVARTDKDKRGMHHHRTGQTTTGRSVLCPCRQPQWRSHKQLGSILAHQNTHRFPHSCHSLALRSRIRAHPCSSSLCRHNMPFNRTLTRCLRQGSV